LNQLNHDLKISPTQSLFRFSYHCIWIDHFVCLIPNCHAGVVFEETMTFLVTCSFLFFFLSFFIFIAMMQCFEDLKKLASSIGWKGNDPIYGLVWFWLYCSLIELDWNEMESGQTTNTFFFSTLWSSNTTVTDLVEPWLENLTNSIFGQVSKSLQWWHYFNCSEYCYLLKL